MRCAIRSFFIPAPARGSFFYFAENQEDNITMTSETTIKSSGVKTTTRKIGNIYIHINSQFDPKKRLEDILFSVANLRLKEKSA